VSAALDAARSARLLFGAELRSGAVASEALDVPAVHTVTRARAPRSAPIRLFQRLAMKTGRLTYKTASAGPMHAARRAVLGDRADGPPRFLIRVDEFPHYQAMNAPVEYGTAQFQRFHAIMASARVPYLIAVLPTLASRPLDPRATGGRPLDDDEIEILRELVGDDVELGVHGYDHRSRSANPRRRTELGGRSAGALDVLLTAGNAVFSGLGLPPPRVFVAPFNHFDASQYESLGRRFDVVCGGPESVRSLGFAATPLWRGDAVYLPAYPPLYGTAAQVLEAARAMIDARWALWVPVVLHWGWEADQGFEDLRRLTETIRPYTSSWAEFHTAVEASR
jgi:peptidoglycan/xylan/chitin deacetylase (PgdA/CDA1 family)